MAWALGRVRDELERVGDLEKEYGDSWQCQQPMEGNFMSRVLCLATLSLVATLVFVPAAIAQELPRDQYGCVPQQTYVPEADGCVAIEGAPGPDPIVYDPDTGRPLGPLSSFIEPPATTPAPLPATGGPPLLLSAGVLLLASGLIGLGVVSRRS